MKKNWPIYMLLLVLVLSLSACGGNGAQEKEEEKGQEEAAKEPLDLTGDWKQVDGNSEDSYQRATIREGQIEVYWVNEQENTESLYWAGTYVAPKTAEKSYEWDSVNNKEKTDTALLASDADTKTFTYADGQLSYSVSAMGMTQTVKLEKQE